MLKEKQIKQSQPFQHQSFLQLFDHLQSSLIKSYKNINTLTKKILHKKSFHQNPYNPNMPPSTPTITTPCCVYGNPCFSVCINPKCKKFGMICEKGYQTKQQCYLFHQQCPQIKWTQLEKIATQNVYNSTQEFLTFRLKIERMFVTAIEKIKEEQEKFRIWGKTFGHSLEVMKFIKLMNDQNYEEISGTLVAPVINSYFKDETNVSRPPAIIEDEFRQIQAEIEQSIENITSLYLRSVKRKTRQQQSMINIQNTSSTTFIPQQKERNTSMLSKSHNIYQEVRERHESQIKIAGQRSAERYNQRQQRLDGSVISETDTAKHSSNSGANNPSTRLRQQQMMQKFNSKIYRHIDPIKRLFQHVRPTSFKLLYRASQNNFSIQEFHRLCDNVPNTLVLVETEFGKVIGGFSALEWKSNKKQWVADKNRVSFIFSLSLNERYELNLPQFAISCNGEKGPIFGCCDICLVDKSNKEKSSAEFPISYNLNKKYHRGDQASFAFTGHPKGQYRTKQWEVFRVEFQ